MMMSILRPLRYLLIVLATLHAAIVILLLVALGSMILSVMGPTPILSPMVGIILLMLMTAANFIVLGNTILMWTHFLPGGKLISIEHFKNLE